MAKEDKNEQVGGQEPKKKVSRMKIFLIAGVVLVILAAAVTGGLFYFGAVASAKKEPLKAPLMGSLWPMDPFIVNLTDNGGERYLKVVIQLEVADPNAIKELDVLKPKLRDSVLDLLSAKSYKDLMDMGGKQRLREEIILRLNSFLTTGKVDRIYFTEFVVQ